MHISINWLHDLRALSFNAANRKELSKKKKSIFFLVYFVNVLFLLYTIILFVSLF
jgi:hypothetical protein